jgi:hypothetical protein
MLPAVAFWSFWTNNTPIVAVMIPILEKWSVRADIPISHLLMPMSFSVILGGLVTVIGTSTSLVVQGLAYPVPLGFFSVGALGAPFCVLGVLFLILFGPFLLPTVKGPRTHVTPVYAWHSLGPDSPHLGKTLLDASLHNVPGAELLWLKPADEEDAHFVPDLKGELSERDRHLPVLQHRLLEKDQLCFVGLRECVEDIDGTRVAWFSGSQLVGLSFFELQLSPDFSSNVSVYQVNALFGFRVRRIYRDGLVLHLGSGLVRDGVAMVCPGDVLIVEAGYQLLHLQRDPRFVSVVELQFSTGRVQSTLPWAPKLHPFLSVLTLLLIVVFNALGFLSIYKLAAVGIAVLVAADLMSWRDVVQAIPGNLMIMICLSFSLAAAMEKSGLSKLIGSSFASTFAGSAYGQLLGLYLCATLVTALAPNFATATIVYPIVTQVVLRCAVVLCCAVLRSWLAGRGQRGD